MFTEMLKALTQQSTEFTLENESLSLLQCWQLSLKLKLCVKLKTLILKNVQLDVAKLDVILVSLKNHKLTLIDFSENPLDDSDKLAKLLREFLSQQSQLQHLVLNKAQLGPKTGNVLIEFIVQTNSLQTITLCDNPFGLEVGKMLVAALCLNTTLTDIKTRNNAWNEGVTQTICFILEVRQDADRRISNVKERLDYILLQYSEYPEHAKDSKYSSYSEYSEYSDTFFKSIIPTDYISVAKPITKIIPSSNNNIIVQTARNVEVWSLEHKKRLGEFAGEADTRIILLPNRQMVTSDSHGTKTKIWTMDKDNKWQMQQSFPTLHLLQVELLPNQQLLTQHLSGDIEIWEKNLNAQWQSIGKFALTKYNFFLWVAKDQFILVTDTQLAVCDFDSTINQWKLSGTHTVENGIQSGCVLDDWHFLLCNANTGVMKTWEKNKASDQWQAIKNSEQYYHPPKKAFDGNMKIIGKLTSDKILLFYQTAHDKHDTHGITHQLFMWNLTNKWLDRSCGHWNSINFSGNLLLQLSENMFLMETNCSHVKSFNEFALLHNEGNECKWSASFSVDNFPFPIDQFTPQKKPHPKMYALENDQFVLAYPNGVLLIFDDSKAILKHSFQKKIEHLQKLKTIAPSSSTTDTSTLTIQEVKQEHPKHDEIKREEHPKEINISAISNFFSKLPAISRRFVSKDGFDLSAGCYAHLIDELQGRIDFSYIKDIRSRLRQVAQNKNKEARSTIAFVNAENTSFNGTSGISGAFHAFFNDGRDQLYEASKSASPHLSPGDAILVHVKKEDVSYCIVQTTSPDWSLKPKLKTSTEIKHDPSAQNDLDLLAKCYFNALKELELYNLEQIKQSQPTITEVIFPSIGTNLCKIPFEVAVPAHIEGISQFFKLYPNSKIHVVMNISHLGREAYEYLFEEPFVPNEDLREEPSNPNISFSQTGQSI